MFTCQHVLDNGKLCRGELVFEFTEHVVRWNSIDPVTGIEMEDSGGTYDGSECFEDFEVHCSACHVDADKTGYCCVYQDDGLYRLVPANVVSG